MASTMDADAKENPCKSDKQTLLAVLQFLQKHNLKETESLLKREAKVSDEDLRSEEDKKPNVQALSVYKSEGDPSLYEDLYQDLKTFIDSCLDVHKVELSTVLYPVFVHMYLELIYNGHEWNASEFYSKFSRDQDENYHKDLASLSSVRKKEHMDGNQLMDTFKSSRFTLKMSRDSYNHLKRHLQEKRLAPLLTIIQDHLFVEVFDGVPRTQPQIEASSGGLLGEVDKDANKVKVLYGLLREPDLNIPLEEEEDGMEGEEKPRKKKMKKDPLLMKKSKTDPNAPNANRIPLPEMKDQDKAEKILAYREALKRIKLDHNHLPSICFYTFLNSFHGVTCVDFAEDSSLLSAGFSDGNIRVWALTPRKLRAMKSPDSLELIDKEADDVLERLYDDRTVSDCKLLVGHSSTVYATSISHDRVYMVSCSEDASIRLWSFLTWTNLVSYKGHNFPVWDVKFGPHSYYFVSAGHDRTARVWATDHPQALRIFAGHLTDVDCCQFHPNSNYVATGSSDKSVRLWDILNGNCVRTFIGHKQTIHCLQFSPGGKHLASGGADRLIFVWDVATGTAVATLKGHTDTIYTLCFGRDGTMLASGGLDDSIRLWDMQKVMAEQDTETDTTVPSNINVNTSPNLLLGTYRTKGTSVLGLHFTRRNLLLGSGPFGHTASS